jgi:hypothetical protein
MLFIVAIPLIWINYRIVVVINTTNFIIIIIIIVVVVVVLHIRTVTCSNHYVVFLRPLENTKTKITNAAPGTQGHIGISVLGVTLVVVYFKGLRKTTWLKKNN